MAADRRGPRGLLPSCELLLLVALSGLCALPLLTAPYLPFLDLPQHIGLATIIHHLHDPAWGFEATYEIDWRPLPYWGFYAPVHGLAFFMPVSMAARLVLFFSALGLPLGVRSLFRAFGRDGRLGLLAVPLIWNTNLYMGFVAFVVAVPLFLFAVAATERLLSAPVMGRRSALAAGALGVLLYLAHGQVFLLFVCALAVLLLSHGSTRGLRVAGRCLVFLPALGLGTFWIAFVVLAPVGEVGSPEHLNVLASLGVIGKVSFDPLLKKLTELPHHLYDVSPGLGDDLPFLILFTGIGLGGLWRVFCFLRGGASERGDPRSAGVGPWHRSLFWIHTRRLELLAFGLLLSYFISPMAIGMQWYVYPRHLLLAALLAPALLPRGLPRRLSFPGRPGAAWTRARASVPVCSMSGIAVALSLAVAAQARSTAAAFSGEAAGFEKILEAATPGGRTLGLIFDNGGGGAVRVWPFLHFAAYLQAAHGGDLGFSFAGLPSLPVRYRPGAQAPHPYEWRPGSFRLLRHGPYYDRYLIRGLATGDAVRLSEMASQVLRSGAWTLIEAPRKKATLRRARGNFSAPGASMSP